jgi:hypothetical protein
MGMQWLESGEREKREEERGEVRQPKCVLTSLIKSQNGCVYVFVNSIEAEAKCRDVLPSLLLSNPSAVTP